MRKARLVDPLDGSFQDFDLAASLIVRSHAAPLPFSPA